MTYLSNAFSLQMLDIAVSNNIHIEPVDPLEVADVVAAGINSAIGHPDTAAVVGQILGVPVPCERCNVHLTKADTLYVAQLTGGRLSEGATTLPEGFRLVFLKVNLI